MALNRNKLYTLTRSTSFLWQSSLVVGLVVLLLGTGISLLNADRHHAVERLMAESFGQTGPLEPDLGPVEPVGFAGKVNGIIRELLDGRLPFGEKLIELHQVISMAGPFDGFSFPDSAELPSLSEDQYRVAAAFAAASRGLSVHINSAIAKGDAEYGITTLMELGEEPQPVPYANYALGLVYEQGGYDASEAYQREAALFNNDEARKRLVQYYVVSKQYDRIAPLEADPGYKPFITPDIQQAVALAKMDWPMLFRSVIPAAYQHTRPAMVVLAMVSGLIWAVILLRFSGTRSLRSAPVYLALPALLLGALSAHATVLFIFWQEHQLHLGMPVAVTGKFAYCMGIGLREEGLKLLLFCPLIPFLWRRTDLEILTVAGLVGLGFAMEENINYFQNSAGLSVLGRFVTANFLHISLTAMGGLTLARACIHRGSGISQAAMTFVTIVAVHGLYDAFMIVPLMEDLSWLSLTVFVFLGYQYFGWLRYLRSDWRDPVSITSMFTLGLVLLIGLSYTLHAWDVGAALAFRNITGEVIGIGIILILFYREIPETLDLNE